MKHFAILAVFLPALGYSEFYGGIASPGYDWMIPAMGFDPQNITDAKFSPFINRAFASEAGNAGLTFKFQFAQSSSTSRREMLFGAHVEARASFKIASGGGSVNFDFGESRAIAKNAWTLQLVVEKDFGTDYLIDQTVANLDATALLYRSNPALWRAAYGTEIVTRVRRGAKVVATINCVTSNETLARSLHAKLTQTASYGPVSGSMSRQISSVIQEGLSQGALSVSIKTLARTPLSPPLAANVYDWQAWIAAINTYLGQMTRENAEITQYQTTSWQHYVPAVQNPINEDPSEAYWRYLSLKGKLGAIDDFLFSWQTQRSWVPANEITRLQNVRPLLEQRAQQALDIGIAQTVNPSSVRQPVPEDVVAPLPRIRRHFTEPVMESYPGYSRTWLVVDGVRPGVYGTWRWVAGPSWAGPYPGPPQQLVLWNQTSTKTTFLLPVIPEVFLYLPYDSRIEYTLFGPAGDHITTESSNPGPGR